MAAAAVAAATRAGRRWDEVFRCVLRGSPSTSSGSHLRMTVGASHSFQVRGSRLPSTSSGFRSLRFAPHHERRRSFTFSILGEAGHSLPHPEVRAKRASKDARHRRYLCSIVMRGIGRTIQGNATNHCFTNPFSSRTPQRFSSEIPPCAADQAIGSAMNASISFNASSGK